MKRNSSYLRISPYLILFSLPLVLLFCTVGCDRIVVNAPRGNTEVVKVESVANSTIYDAMVADKVSKEDAEVIYKNFVGLVNYMPHSKKLDNTVKVFQLMKEFQTEYGHERGVYKSFTDAVEKYLIDAGYKQPKRIVDKLSEVTLPNLSDIQTKEVSRSQVIADMKVIADSVEKYLRGLK